MARDGNAADVVRIGSIIEFEVDDGRRLKVQLVLPENADINAGRISVLTPVGAALIGLSPGQSMEWSGNDGKERVLTVLAVSGPQPTDAGRFSARYGLEKGLSMQNSAHQSDRHFL